MALRVGTVWEGLSAMGDAFELLVLISFAAICITQALGIPVALLRLRRSRVWRERPNQVAQWKHLAEYVAPVTVLVVIWALAVSVSAGVAHVLDRVL
ncbi:MAG TPA: hypothetical protein VFZ41_00245 [Solirubrobacterales bacterium]